MQHRTQWALVAAVLVVAVAVDGYLAYRYYERLSKVNGASESALTSERTASERTASERTASESALTSERTSSETTMPKTTAPEAKAEPITTDLVQRAAASNVIDNSTYVDDPLTNGKPDALLHITRARGPGNAADYGHHTGVWYDGSRGRWAIFNQDLAPMEEGSTFEVAVLEDNDGFVHRAEPANTEGNRTYLDNPRTNDDDSNGDPDAALSVTPNWNPGSGEGVYNDHPVGVFYEKNVGKWAVFNLDDAPMPDGAAFNVAVSRGSESAR